MNSMWKYIFFLTIVILSGGKMMAEYSDHRNRHVDSLENVLNSGRELSDEEELKIYKELMWGYLQIDGSKTTYYADCARKLSKKHHYLDSEADALRIMGLVEYGAGNYDRALDYFNEALEITDRMHGESEYRQKDIDDNLSALYGSIGNLYNMQDKLHLAIEYYQRALTIFEKYGWLESTSILYFNVAELYASMGNEDEAVTNYEKSLEIAKKTGDSCIIACPEKGLGKMYVNAGNYEKAIPLLDAAYEYYSTHMDEENDAYIEVVTSKGSILLQEKNIAGAEKNARTAIGRINADTGFETQADVYNLCCEIEMEKKHWQKALEYAMLAINIDKEETYTDMGTYVHMAQIYTELGDKQKAKQTIEHVHNGMEKFATEHYQSGISQMQILYETEKKENTIAELRQQRRWMMIIVVLTVALLLIVLLIFFLLWRIMRQKRKHEIVQAQLAGEIAERVRISRDLHDRLGGILTALKLKLQPQSETAKLTDDAIIEMRNVAHHLLPYSLTHYGLKTALQDYCNTFRNVRFTYLGDEKNVENPEVVYCIVYELVNNAVKNGAQHVEVLITAGDDFLAVNVCDNGNGLPTLDPKQGSGLKNIKEIV